MLQSMISLKLIQAVYVQTQLEHGKHTHTDEITCSQTQVLIVPFLFLHNILLLVRVALVCNIEIFLPEAVLQQIHSEMHLLVALAFH